MTLYDIASMLVPLPLDQQKVIYMLLGETIARKEAQASSSKVDDRIADALLNTLSDQQKAIIQGSGKRKGRPPTKDGPIAIINELFAMNNGGFTLDQLRDYARKRNPKVTYNVLNTRLSRMKTDGEVENPRHGYWQRARSGVKTAA